MFDKSFVFPSKMCSKKMNYNLKQSNIWLREARISYTIDKKCFVSNFILAKTKSQKTLMNKNFKTFHKIKIFLCNNVGFFHF